MTTAPVWEAVVQIQRATAVDADRVAQALAPELTREVPRARAELARTGPASLALRILAEDTSACRAALNTYLAWVGLVLSIERAVGAAGSPDLATKSPGSRSA